MRKLLKLFLVSLSLLGILQSNVNAADTTQQTAFIERFYQNILNRTADTGGMNTWLDVIQNQSATQVAMGFLNSQEFNNLNLTNDEFLDIMYQTMFDRQADDGGKTNWLQKMNNGRSKQSVMFGFFNSQEFKNLTDSFGVTQILPTDKPSYQGVESYVNRFYNLVLKREPDDAGFDDWVKQLTNKTKDPTEIASGFLFSQEYTNQNENNSTFLDTCYKAFFGRDADVGGKTDWLNKLNDQNYTKQQIFEGFTGSQEFANLVNGFNLDADTTPPVFTSNSIITVEENQTSVITVSTTDDSDVRYTLAGLDKDSFNIDENTGVITFKDAPDYETKNSYSIVVRAIDTLGNVGVQSVTIGVSDVRLNLNNFSSLMLTNRMDNFLPIISANISTEYISNEITFTGNSIPLRISIDNEDFSIIKNDIEITSTNTTIVDGDRIKLKTKTGTAYNFNYSVNLKIEQKFSDIASMAKSYTEAVDYCSSMNSVLPTTSQLNTYSTSNPNLFTSPLSTWHGDTNAYWTTNSNTLGSFGITYDTSNKTSNDALLSFNYGAICIKSYENISFTITTLNDPNPAPIANAGQDKKIYFTEDVILDASNSFDNAGIVSYEWIEGTTILSDQISFVKSDFSLGTHNITLNVTDDDGKTSSDATVITIFNDFTNILPMSEVGGIKSISSSTIGTTTTTTLSAGSQLYFKITNDTDRNFSVSKFTITSYYNNYPTVRASSTNSSLLSDGTLTSSEFISLGYSLTSNQTANYWVGTYTLTDIKTGEIFTNSFTWNGTRYN